MASYSFEGELYVQDGQLYVPFKVYCERLARSLVRFQRPSFLGHVYPYTRPQYSAPAIPTRVFTRSPCSQFPFCDISNHDVSLDAATVSAVREALEGDDPDA